MKIEFEIQITFFSKYQMIVLTHTFAIPRKQARKLQDTQAEKLTSLQANKLTSW